MKKTYIYLLSLGGNLGDVRATFESIEKKLCRIGTIARSSSLYTSESWGFDGPDFLNKVIEFHTTFTPELLLAMLQQLEREHGRTHKTAGNHFTSRPIDIDMLYCQRYREDSPNLTVPHALISQRRFVLVPLSEYWSDHLDVRTGKTVKQMLADCPDQSRVDLFLIS